MRQIVVLDILANQTGSKIIASGNTKIPRWHLGTDQPMND
jgi:hypothetical protein